MIAKICSFVEVILSMRTWAVWNRNKMVGILLAVSIIASSVAECILLNNFVQGLECAFSSLLYGTIFDSFVYLDAPPPYPGFRGCFIAKSDRSSLWGNYAALTAVQASKRYSLLPQCSLDIHPCSFPCTHGNQRLSVMLVVFPLLSRTRSSLHFADRQGNFGRLSLIVYRDGRCPMFILS
jgi:hypothetical protein